MPKKRNEAERVLNPIPVAYCLAQSGVKSRRLQLDLLGSCWRVLSQGVLQASPKLSEGRGSVDGDGLTRAERDLQLRARLRLASCQGAVESARGSRGLRPLLRGSLDRLHARGLAGVAFADLGRRRGSGLCSRWSARQAPDEKDVNGLPVGSPARWPCGGRKTLPSGTVRYFAVRTRSLV